MNKPLVIVVWRDAHGTNTATYTEHDLPHKALRVITVGWLIRDDEAGVSVCNEDCADGEWRGHSFIPREMVVSVTPVIKPRKRNPKCPALSSAEFLS